MIGLETVRAAMRAACERAGRPHDDVTLVAVSKGQPVHLIEEAYAAGHRVFGESRAQELADKVAQLPSDIVWHFVGPLQRNKVRIVRPVVQLLHSMDRLKLAEAWLKGPGDAPQVLVQVRLGGEATKHGFDPSRALDAVGSIRDLGLEVRGLMTIPPPVAEPEQARSWFAELRRLRDELVRSGIVDAADLSMGMSADYEVAIEEGATLIRVGSAIFGERKT